MNDYKVSKVVEKLVGKVKPTGDSHIDEERLENLKELEEVLGYAVNEMSIAASYKGYKEHSMSKAGNMAHKYLIDLRDVLCHEYGNPENDEFSRLEVDICPFCGSKTNSFYSDRNNGCSRCGKRFYVIESS